MLQFLVEKPSWRCDSAMSIARKELEQSHRCKILPSHETRDKDAGIVPAKDGMGRITVFTTVGCKHCSRVKIALATRDIPYVEISLSRHPERRKDMLALSDRLTVPQVFFNDDFVGGADEVLDALDRWEKGGEHETSALDRFRAEIESVDGGPTDIRLSPPSASPVDEARAPASPPREMSEGCIQLLDGSEKKASVVAIISHLMKVMPRADLTWRTRVYKDCFKGRDGVTALMQYFNLSSREEAVAFGRTLQRSQILDHVCSDHMLGDNGYYYRLQPFHRPHVLNSFRVWIERVEKDAMALLLRLRKLLDQIIASVTDSRGLVDYIAAADHPLYYVFEEKVCELQAVNIASMDEKARLCFCISLYNMMITHAFIKVGIASTSAQRSVFFGNISYDVGGDELSFDELEHGVLRANSRPPYSLITPFSRDDPHFRLALIKLDPRVHFAVSCGSESCPPITDFTAGSIDEELQLVSLAFCEDADNVSIDDEVFELSLSMLFYWYRPDFSPSLSKLPNVVSTYLRGEKQAKLQRMIRSGRHINLVFKPYNWATDASRCKSFDTSRLDPNQPSVKALYVRSSTPQTKTTIRRSIIRRRSSGTMASFRRRLSAPPELSGACGSRAPSDDYSRSVSSRALSEVSLCCSSISSDDVPVPEKSRADVYDGRRQSSVF